MAVEKLVDVAGELIERAAGTLRAGAAGGEPPTRDVFARSVEAWLPVVVATARAAGLVHGATQQRRPRRFDEATWAALDRGEKEVGVSRVALLRGCLELQAQHGDRVSQFLRTLSRVVADVEQALRPGLLAAEEG